MLFADELGRSLVAYELGRLLVADELGRSLVADGRALELQQEDLVGLDGCLKGDSGGVPSLMMWRVGGQNGLCLDNGDDGSGRGDCDNYDDGNDDDEDDGDWNKFDCSRYDVFGLAMTTLR